MVEALGGRPGRPLASSTRNLPHGRRAPPVLLVHGFGQNRYAWHLPSRSFANHLARAGFDVFNLDLRGHGRSRLSAAGARRGVDDYVERGLADGRRGGAVARPAAPHLARRALARRPRRLRRRARASRAPSPASSSIGSPYHFTRGSLTLGAPHLFFRALALARRCRNAPLPLAPVACSLSAHAALRGEPALSVSAPRLARGVVRAARPRAAPPPRVRPRGARARCSTCSTGPRSAASADASSDYAERFETMDFAAPRHRRGERRPRAPRERAPRLHAEPLDRTRRTARRAARAHRFARRAGRAAHHVVARCALDHEARGGQTAKVA